MVAAIRYQQNKYSHDKELINMSTHNYNFENATEKRAADKKFGFINFPPCDGQVKHPEHLQQHEHLQILQRHALNGNTEKVREMIAELPEHQVKDTVEMLKRTVADFGRELEL